MCRGETTEAVVAVESGEKGVFGRGEVATTVPVERRKRMMMMMTKIRDEADEQ